MAEDKKQIKNISNEGDTRNLPMDRVMSNVNRRFKEKECKEKAKELKMNYVDISRTPVNPDILKIIDSNEAKTAELIVFNKLGQKIDVAVADPNKEETKKLIEKLQSEKFEITQHLASDIGIIETLDLYKEPLYQKEKELKTKIERDKIISSAKEIESLGKLKEKIETSASKEALYYINIGAIKAGASDIHFQPEEKDVLVRFRIDGILHNIFKISSKSYKEIATQIKYNSKLIINVYDIPQDGRYYFEVNDSKIDVRVSVLPTQFGETIVCRLLDTTQKVLNYKDLGFYGKALKDLEYSTKYKEGMILVTGPTGSGKTTTLYSLLSEYNTEDVKIITLENPIEYHIEGVSQSQVNEDKDYTFAKGLRAILRQDPDIVMIGEIRDLDTGRTATQAALTGHVVISTLHTNSALATIPRLVNMGLPHFMIAPSLKTIIAQRLVRKLCPDCKQAKKISNTEKETIEKSVEEIKKIYPNAKINLPDQLYHPKGCEKCSDTGYKGRTVIAEVILLDDEIRDMILNKKGTEKLFKEVRKKGMLTMFEDGVLKVLQNITTLEEVNRVSSQTE